MNVPKTSLHLPQGWGNACWLTLNPFRDTLGPAIHARVLIRNPFWEADRFVTVGNGNQTQKDEDVGDCGGHDHEVQLKERLGDE